MSEEQTVCFEGAEPRVQNVSFQRAEPGAQRGQSRMSLWRGQSLETMLEALTMPSSSSHGGAQVLHPMQMSSSFFFHR